MGIGVGANPFRPGTGLMPPLLAGRERELGLVAGRLSELAADRPPPQGILLYGPRGCGKTALLKAARDQGPEFGVRVESLPAAILQTETGMIRKLQESAGLVQGGLTALQIGPLGATGDRARPSEDASVLLPMWIRTARTPLVVLLDEVQTIGTAAARAFCEALQLVAQEEMPFLLIAAGTPDAPRTIRRAGSFMERALEEVPVSRLDRGAAAEALARPARAAGRPMTETALNLLLDESQDYPFFIQLLGRAAWDAAETMGTPAIAGDAARAGVNTVRPVIARFYARRFAEAEEHGVDHVLVPLVSLLAGENGRVGNAALRRLLERSVPPGDGQRGWVGLRSILQDLGIVWETEPGVWEMGIPSFARFVLAHGTR